MSLYGIKPITAISDSTSFCRKIMQKHQTGTKNTSSFPMMFFFKKRGYFFPEKISMILNFRLYLKQQNIAPVLILRNFPVTGRRISGLNSEKKSLQSIFRIISVQSTDDVPKIFPTSFQIPHDYHFRSGHFLTENISANKTPLFSFLKSVIFKAGNVANSSNKILYSLFSPASNVFIEQKTCTISPDIFALNSKILSYENNTEIFNSHSGTKIWHRLLNTANSFILINKENSLKFLPVFENGSSSNYLGKQSTISSFISSLAVKNISVINETFSWLKTEKHGMKSLMDPEDSSNRNDANVSLAAIRIPELYQAASGILSTGKIFANKTPLFSSLKDFIFKSEKIATKSNKMLKSSFFPAIDKEYVLNHWPLFEDKSPSNYSGKQNTIPFLIVKNIPVAGGRISGLNVEKKVFQSTFQIKNVRSADNVPNIFLTSLKIPQEHHVPSEHFLTRNISANKIPFFLFLKSLTFKAENVTNNSNKTIKSFFSPSSSAFYQQKVLTIALDILTRNSKILSYILSYENSMEILNSQIAGKKIYYRLLNIAGNSALTDKENARRSRSLSEDKSPLNHSGNKNTILSFLPSLVVKNIHLIKEILSRLNTEKNCLKSTARQKDTINMNYTSNVYVSQAVFKVPQGFYEGSDFLLTENTFPNKFLTENIATKKISVFSLLKPFIFRAENITDNSNKILKSPFLPADYDFHSQKTRTIFPDILSLNRKTGLVRELLINSEKVSVLTVIDRYFDRFRPFRFSTTHTHHDPFLKYLVFKAGNKITNSNRILKPQLRSENSIYYQQVANSTYSGAVEVSFQVLNSKINEKILNLQVLRANKNYESLNITRHSHFFNKKSVLKNQPFFKGKLPAVFLQENSSFKDNSLSNKKPGMNRRFFKESSWVTSNGPLIKNNYGNSGHGTPAYVQSNHNYKMRPENLVFRDQGHIEQEIEQVKRTIIETKKSVSEKTVPVFGEAEIKKYLDINRISSQVYQNLERKIRMERESRGM